MTGSGKLSISSSIAGFDEEVTIVRETCMARNSEWPPVTSYLGIGAFIFTTQKVMGLPTVISRPVTLSLIQANPLKPLEGF